MKIQIFDIYGNVLFELEKEDNTIKETVELFLKQNLDTIIKKVDLSFKDLSGISF
jgi:hypothetical protein